MDYTIFMNSKNSKESDCHRLRAEILDKTDSKKSDKYLALSNLSICYKGKNINNYNNNPPIRIYVNKMEKNQI